MIGEPPSDRGTFHLMITEVAVSSSAASSRGAEGVVAEAVTTTAPAASGVNGALGSLANPAPTPLTALINAEIVTPLVSPMIDKGEADVVAVSQVVPPLIEYS